MPDKTFTTGASFGTLPFYVDPNFERLMIHLCTVIQASVPADDATNYGHGVPSFTTGTISTANVKCRLRPLSQQELAAEGALGQQVADYYLDIPCWRAPEIMFASNAAALCRIEHVTFRGMVLDEGPFDIQGVARPGGLLHHFLLRVRRIN